MCKINGCWWQVVSSYSGDGIAKKPLAVTRERSTRFACHRLYVIVCRLGYCSRAFCVYPSGYFCYTEMSRA